MYPRLIDWKRRGYRATRFRTSNQAGDSSGPRSNKRYLKAIGTYQIAIKKLLEAERDAVKVCAVLVELGCRVIEHTLVG